MPTPDFGRGRRGARGAPKAGRASGATPARRADARFSASLELICSGRPAPSSGVRALVRPCGRAAGFIERAAPRPSARREASGQGPREKANGRQAVNG